METFPIKIIIDFRIPPILTLRLRRRNHIHKALIVIDIIVPREIRCTCTENREFQWDIGDRNFYSMFFEFVVSNSFGANYYYSRNSK